MNEVTKIGAHRVSLEGDTMRVVFQGLVSLPEIQAIVAVLTRWQQERKGIQYLFYDASRLLPFEPDVKRWVMNDFKGPPLRGVLVVGASPTLRVMMTVVLKTLELVRQKLERPIILLKTEADALAWIEADRKKLRGGN